MKKIFFNLFTFTILASAVCAKDRGQRSGFKTFGLGQKPGAKDNNYNNS